MALSIVYSPCPNDTFIFHAWAHGAVPDAPPLEVTYADIDVTNQLAMRGDGPDMLKISFAALPWALQSYALLPCGGALGRGCGPLVLQREAAAVQEPGVAVQEPGVAVQEPGVAVQEPEVAAVQERGVAVQEPGAGAVQEPGVAAVQERGAAEPGGLPPALYGKVAVPSDRSTAYLLFRLWAAASGATPEIVVLPFHEIMPAIRDGQVDAGLVIHEARFTYGNFGLQLVADLGSWWEAQTGLPIPLGAIVAKRTLAARELVTAIRHSLAMAWADPAATEAYVMAHAQEMDPEVARQHIALYVNRYSHELGTQGEQAVRLLLDRAAEHGLVPPVDWSTVWAIRPE